MKIIIGLFSSAVLFGLSLCVMLFGWGLKPVSWGWVIWGSIGAIIVSAFIQAMGELE
jgi:hypothetical protein